MGIFLAQFHLLKGAGGGELWATYGRGKLAEGQSDAISTGGSIPVPGIGKASGGADDKLSIAFEFYGLDLIERPCTWPAR